MPKLDRPIETLIAQLHGEDWIARCDAARLLGQSGDPRAVDALLTDLKDPDWRVRRNATQALGALRDRRAVESLLQALQDKTMTVRQRAIVALGRMKDLRALPALLEILLANKRESYEAAKAIRKFGKKAIPEIAKAFENNNDQQLMMLLIEMKYQGAFDLILKLLRSEDPTARLTGIRELGKLGNKKAIPYLIEQLNTDDLMSQSEIVRALGMLDAVETIPILLDLLTDHELYGPRSSVYYAVTEAFQNFGGITEEIKNAFPGTYPTMFNMGGASLSLPEAIGLLGNNQSQMLNEALSKLQNSAQKRAELPGMSSEAINRIFENMAWKFGITFADARDARQDRVTRLLELLKSESNPTRSAAALTLPWYGEERALAPLEQATKDSNAIARRAATWAFRALQKALLYRKQFGL